MSSFLAEDRPVKIIGPALTEKEKEELAGLVEILPDTQPRLHTDERPKLSAYGNAVGAERILVLIWELVQACEDFLDEPGVDNANHWGLGYETKGLLWVLKGVESWFESEVKTFPAWARRRVAQAEADGDTVSAEAYGYLADESQDPEVAHAAFCAVFEARKARRQNAGPSPEPILVEA